MTPLTHLINPAELPHLERVFYFACMGMFGLAAVATAVFLILMIRKGGY